MGHYDSCYEAEAEREDARRRARLREKIDPELRSLKAGRSADLDVLVEAGYVTWGKRISFRGDLLFVEEVAELTDLGRDALAELK